MKYNLTLTGLDGDWKINADTKLISGDYTATENDYFIHAQIPDGRTITLPAYPDDGTLLVIKMDTEQWADTRTLTIKTIDRSTINGDATLVLRRPTEAVQLISAAGDWHIISKYG